MTERLDVRPGEEHPAVREILGGGTSQTDRSDRTESRRERINPEDPRMPGNVGWTSGIRDAVAKKSDQMSLWARSLGDRGVATAESVLASKARTKESALGKRANQFSQRESHHSNILTQLEARSGAWNLPIARNITGMQAAYHSWRERANHRKASRIDAKAERAGKKAARAEKYQRFYDGKVALRVEKVSTRWQAKLDAVRGPRENIDGVIAEIGETIVKNEALINSIRERTTRLESMTGGDRTARREQLRGLYKTLASEESALKEKYKELGIKQKHRVRLAVAEDSAEESLNAFRMRYESHSPWSPAGTSLGETGTTPQSTDTRPQEDRFDWSLRDLAESKGDITNEQVGKIWNELFVRGKLPDGYKTLITLMQYEFPNKNISDAPDATMSVKDFLDGLRQIHEELPEFRSMVERATGKKGEKGINELVGRFETKIAFTEDIKDL